jgi:CheY-like chemotaxis protein
VNVVVPTMRSIAVTLVASAWVLFVVSPRRRRAIARRLANARHYVSRRIVDEDARRSSQAIAAWEDVGGAMRVDELAYTHAAPIEVLVIDRDRGRRQQVSEAFRAEGCHVVEAADSIEALDALTHASVPTEVIAVADTEPESVGVELRDHLDRAYASALIVGIGGPEWIPTHAQLDPSDADGLLREHVRALLMLAPIRPSGDVADS